ncbi:hypothetical protein MAR_000582, partial [Mya arenaria]
TDRYKEFAEYEGYAYDETNKRTRSIEEIEAGREREIYDILRLYNSNQEYRVNLRTKQCNMTTIDHPFRMKGVPPGSKFLFESVLGAAGIPGEFITAQTFSGAFEDGAQYVVTVTTPDCVPIIFNIESNKTDEHYEDRMSTGLNSRNKRIADLIFFHFLATFFRLLLAGSLAVESLLTEAAWLYLFLLHEALADGHSEGPCHPATHHWLILQYTSLLILYTKQNIAIFNSTYGKVDRCFVDLNTIPARGFTFLLLLQPPTLFLNSKICTIEHYLFWVEFVFLLFEFPGDFKGGLELNVGLVIINPHTSKVLYLHCRDRGDMTALTRTGTCGATGAGNPVGTCASSTRSSPGIGSASSFTIPRPRDLKYRTPPRRDCRYQTLHPSPPTYVPVITERNWYWERKYRIWQTVMVLSDHVQGLALKKASELAVPVCPHTSDYDQPTPTLITQHPPCCRASSWFSASRARCWSYVGSSNLWLGIARLLAMRSSRRRSRSFSRSDCLANHSFR